MSTKIRLTRLGDKKSPIYRIIVADSRQSRDGQYIEQIGFFNPKANPEIVKVDVEKAQKWVNTGAEISDTVRALLKKNGVEIKAKKAKKVAPKKAAAKAAAKTAAKPAAKTATKAAKPAAKLAAKKTTEKTTETK